MSTFLSSRWGVLGRLRPGCRAPAGGGARCPFRLQPRPAGKVHLLRDRGRGIGLAWGRGGMLTLGQGVFFGLGAYIMAMHLKLADASLFGGSGVPDFMSLYGTGNVPGWWEPFRSPVVTLLAVVLVPGLVALILDSPCSNAASRAPISRSSARLSRPLSPFS